MVLLFLLIKQKLRQFRMTTNLCLFNSVAFLFCSSDKGRSEHCSKHKTSFQMHLLQGRYSISLKNLFQSLIICFITVTEKILSLKFYFYFWYRGKKKVTITMQLIISSYFLSLHFLDSSHLLCFQGSYLPHNFKGTCLRNFPMRKKLQF